MRWRRFRRLEVLDGLLGGLEGGTGSSSSAMAWEAAWVSWLAAQARIDGRRRPATRRAASRSPAARSWRVSWSRPATNSPRGSRYSAASDPSRSAAADMPA